MYGIKQVECLPINMNLIRCVALEKTAEYPAQKCASWDGEMLFRSPPVICSEMLGATASRTNNVRRDCRQSDRWRQLAASYDCAPAVFVDSIGEPASFRWLAPSPWLMSDCHPFSAPRQDHRRPEYIAGRDKFTKPRSAAGTWLLIINQLWSSQQYLNRKAAVFAEYSLINLPCFDGQKQRKINDEKSKLNGMPKLLIDHSWVTI